MRSCICCRDTPLTPEWFLDAAVSREKRFASHVRWTEERWGFNGSEVKWRKQVRYHTELIAQWRQSREKAK